jgi:hypothetical protein
MFRVYIEGKSPKELVANTRAWLKMIDGSREIEAYAEGVGEGMKLTEEDIADHDFAPVPEQVEPAMVAQANDGPLDSRGIPWDARIHSASRATNKDGSWRVRRGADEKEVVRIEALLKDSQETIFGIPADAPFVPPVPAAPVAELPPIIVPDAPPPFVQPSPAIPITPAPSYDPIPVPQSTKPAHTFETFKKNFIQAMSGLVISGELTPGYIEELKKYFQVKEIVDVSKDDFKTQQLFDTLVQGGKITKVG